MNIDLRKVRNTPYKIVLSDWRIIGMIERKDNKDCYTSFDGFDQKQKEIAAMLHADTLMERLGGK